jgi:hypothetical protein
MIIKGFSYLMNQKKENRIYWVCQIRKHKCKGKKLLITALIYSRTTCGKNNSFQLIWYDLYFDFYLFLACHGCGNSRFLVFQMLAFIFIAFSFYLINRSLSLFCSWEISSVLIGLRYGGDSRLPHCQKDSDPQSPTNHSKEEQIHWRLLNIITISIFWARKNCFFLFFPWYSDCFKKRNVWCTEYWPKIKKIFNKDFFLLLIKIIFISSKSSSLIKSDFFLLR